MAVSAFQADTFQNDSFQETASSGAGHTAGATPAFQVTAFQRDTFQLRTSGATVVGISNPPARGALVGRAVVAGVGQSMARSVGTAVGVGAPHGVGLAATQAPAVGTIVGAGAAHGVGTQGIQTGFALITFNGAPLEVLLDSLQIHVAAPKTCTFKTLNASITDDMAIEVKVGTGASFVSLFLGSVIQVSESHLDDTGNLVFEVTCSDTMMRKFNRQLVWAAYTQQSATAIALNLLSAHSSGFTTTWIAAGLPTITGGIVFDGVTLEECFTQLANRVGGYFRLNGLDPHLFITESDNAPDTLDVNNLNLFQDPPFTIIPDSSQLRTRTIVVGAGSTTLAPIPTGTVLIPLQDATAFADSGQALSGDGQLLTYTSRDPGGVTTNVTSTAGPTGAPSATLSSTTVGQVLGVVSYKTTFKNAAGETIPGPAGNTVTGVAFAVPSQPAVTGTSGIGVLVGTFGYKCTFVTSLGETTPSLSTSRAASALATPLTPTKTQSSNTIGKLTGGGVYSYAITYVSQYGETTIGLHSTNITIGSINNPSAPTGSYTTGGALTVSSWYGWAVTFVGPNGEETLIGTEFSAVSGGGGNAMALTGIPLGPTGTVARRLYRSPAVGNSSLTGPKFLVTTINDNTTTTYKDILADTGLGSAPPTSSNNFGGVVTVSSIFAGPVGVLARRVYRTKAGGSEYFFVGQISDNLTTSFVDNVPDSSLSVAAPLLNTAGGEIHNLTIITGPAGTLARRIYRTRAGGTEYFFLGQISDNVTSTFSDNTLDSSLGAQAPLVNTAGASAVSVTGIQLGGAGITSRRLFRTKNGGSTWYFVEELRDNTTSTYLDTKADSELGDVAPDTGTLGAVKGDTTLNVKDTSNLPTSGWAQLDSMLIFWTGKTSTSLTGIFPTGAPGGTPLLNGLHGIGATTLSVKGCAASGTYKQGDIVSLSNQGTKYTVQSDATADGSGNVSITILPALVAAGPNNTNVSLSARVGSLAGNVAAETILATTPVIGGVSGIATTMKQGESLRYYTVQNSTAGQAALIVREGGGSGIIEFKIDDPSLTTPTAAQAAGLADVTLFGLPMKTGSFTTRDVKIDRGKTFHIDLPLQGAPSQDFVVLDAMIDQIGTLEGVYPRYQVNFGNVRFSYQDILRRLSLGG